jgi:dienelactone hydrolase
MRAFELLLLLACAAFSIRLAAGGRASTWIHAMQLALALLVLAQLLLEGWRWQVFPAYAAAVLIALTPAVLGQTALVLLCSAGATFCLLAASIGACLVFPFIEPRFPAGSIAAGTTSIPVSVTHSATEPKELQAQPEVLLWYPTPQPGWRARFVADLQARVEHGLRAIPTEPATRAAAIARLGRKFPVILYFDGWPEDKTQNVNLILELVSRGFAVASVTYRGIDRPLVVYSSDIEMQRSVQLDHERTRAHARDAVAALNVLEKLATEPNGPFTNTLDTQHAGALGFSFGGAVAAQFARIDPRVRSAINLDGRHWGDALDSGVSKPYMFICEELIIPSDTDVASPDPATRYEARLDRIDYAQLDKNQLENGGIRVTIPGVAHMNFTDVPLRSPLIRYSSNGKLDARRVQEIIRTYVVEFFARYGTPGHTAPPLDTPWPQFPEARVSTWASPH